MPEADYSLVAEITPELSRNFSRQVQRDIKAALSKVQANAKVGVDFNTAGLQTSLNKAVRAAGVTAKVGVEIDAKKLQRELNRAAREVSATVKVGVELDPKRMQRMLNKTAGDAKTTINVNVDDELAKAKLLNLQERNRAIRIKADLDDANAKLKLRRIAEADYKAHMRLELDKSRLKKLDEDVDNHVSKLATRAERQFQVLLFAGIFAALPASAAIAGAGVVAGLSAIPAAAIGVGAALQKNNTELRNSYSQLRDHAVTQLRAMSTPIADELIPATDQLKSAFDRIRPSLNAVFSDSAPVVSTFLDGVVQLSERAMPGLVTATQHAGIPMQGLRDLLAQVGDGMTHFFENLSQGAVGSQNTLRTFGGVIEDLLGFTGTLFANLATGGNTALQQFRGGLIQVESVISTLTDPHGGLPFLTGVASGFLGTVGGGLSVLQGFANILGDWAAPLGRVGGAALSTNFALKLFGTNLSSIAGGAGGIKAFQQGVDKAGEPTLSPFKTAMEGATGKGNKFKAGLGAIASSGFNPLGVAALGVGLIVDLWGKKQQENAIKVAAHKKNVEDLTQAIREDGGAFGEVTKKYQLAALEQKNVGNNAKVTGSDLGEFAAAALGSGRAMDTIRGKSDQLILSTLKTAGASDKSKESLLAASHQALISGGDFASSGVNLDTLGEAAHKGASSFKGLTNEQKGALQAIINANGALGEQIKAAREAHDQYITTESALTSLSRAQIEARDATKKHTDAIYEQVNANLGYRGAVINAKKAQEELTKVMADGKSTALDRSEAELKLEEAIQRQVVAAGQQASAAAVGASDSEKASRALNAQNTEAVRLANTYKGDLPESLRETLSKMNATEAQAAGLRVEVDKTGQAIYRLPDGKTIKIDAQTQIATGDLSSLRSLLIGLPNEKEIHLTALTAEAESALTQFGFQVTRMPDGTVKIVANTQPAQRALSDFIVEGNLAKATTTVFGNTGPALGAVKDWKNTTEATEGHTTTYTYTDPATKAVTQWLIDTNTKKALTQTYTTTDPATGAIDTFVKWANGRVIHLGVDLMWPDGIPVTAAPGVPKSVVGKGIHAARAAGGFVYGPGTATSDSIPARLSDGEFVVRSAQAQKHGALLESINSGRGFATGGWVGYAAGGQVGAGTLAQTTSLGDPRLASAAREILSAWQRGVAVFEDFSFKGMSQNAATYNDQLWKLTQGNIQQLQSVSSATSAMGLIAEDGSRVSASFYDTTSAAYQLAGSHNSAGSSAVQLSTAMDYQLLPSIVKLGSVTDSVWQGLLAQGWKGDPNDKMEALHKPAGGGNTTKGPVVMGSVSMSKWNSLLKKGWMGKPGDKMEALYPPGTPGTRRVAQYANGGALRGAGGPTSDNIPIMGSNGEFMIKAAAVQHYGAGLFELLNAQKLAAGGLVGTGVQARTTYLGDPSLAAAAREILGAWQRGVTVFEDLSFKGMSQNAATFNDQLANLTHGNMDQLGAIAAHASDGAAKLSSAMNYQLLPNIVKLGSVTESVWQGLLAQGWKGNPNDKMEALHKPAGGGAPANGPVVLGSVPVDTWNSLLKKGWMGNPNDKMEALYPPGTPGTRRVVNGRVVAQYANGGALRGPGGATSDSIPIMGSNGEFMVRAAAVQHYGVGLFELLNAQKLADGGPVGATVTAPATAAPSSLVINLPDMTAATVATQALAAAVAALSASYTALNLTTGVVTPVLNAVTLALSTVANTASGMLAPTLDAVSLALTTVANTANGLLIPTISTLQLANGGLVVSNDTLAQSERDLAITAGTEWGNITNAVNRSVDDQVIAHENLKNSLALVRTAFTDTANWANAEFQRAYGAAADPIRAIINQPIRGLVDAWNSLDGQFALGKHVTAPVAAFADGGAVSGPGSGTSDSIPAKLSNGEFVVREKITKKITPFLSALNSGQAEALQAAGYATGGLVNGNAVAASVDRAKVFAAQQTGKPYIWGGVGPDGYDCSGFMSAITNTLLGRNPYQRLGVAASEPWAGFVPGLSSAFAMGASSSHTAGTLGGINAEATGDHVRFGGDAHGADDGQFPIKSSLPVVGGQFVSGGGAAFDPASMVSGAFKNAMDGISSIQGLFPGNIAADIGGGIARKAGEGAQSSMVSKISALGMGGGGAGVEQWRGTVLQALGILHLPASLADITLRRMNQESGGDATAVNGWDSNAAKGTPSKGLMQVIDPTFRAYMQAGFGNIMAPLDNILASMNYAIGRYGSLPAAYNKPGGYNNGGVVPGTGFSDSVHAMLTPGEAVLTPKEKAAYQAHAAAAAQGELRLDQHSINRLAAAIAAAAERRPNVVKVSGIGLTGGGL